MPHAVKNDQDYPVHQAQTAQAKMLNTIKNYRAVMNQVQSFVSIN